MGQVHWDEAVKMKGVGEGWRMLTGAVIKAEQVLVPFGKMEIRRKKKKKKKINPEEEEYPQKRRVTFHRGVTQELKEKASAGN